MLYDPSKERPVDAPGWILWNAADYIEKHGWCKYTFNMPDGRACMMGAIEVVVSGDVAPTYLDASAREAVFRLEKRVMADPTSESGGLHSPIPRWNDQPGRTKEQVVAALRAAALVPHV